jgi:hypothetical protein
MLDRMSGLQRDVSPCIFPLWEIIDGVAKMVGPVKARSTSDSRL